MSVKKPTFKRQHSEKKRIQGKSWRKPRGIDSRQQKHKKDRGALPRVGYGTPKAVRGSHPTGVREVLVKTMADLETVVDGMVARLSSTLGKKKREGIRKKAEEKKIKVLN